MIDTEKISYIYHFFIKRKKLLEQPNVSLQRHFYDVKIFDKNI